MSNKEALMVNNINGGSNAGTNAGSNAGSDAGGQNKETLKVMNLSTGKSIVGQINEIKTFINELKSSIESLNVKINDYVTKEEFLANDEVITEILKNHAEALNHLQKKL